MEKFFWVSPRESDSFFNKYIEDAISYYSSENKQEFRSQIPYGEQYNFLIEKNIRSILGKKKNAKFMFYNPKNAYSLSKDLHSHFICLNSFRILNMLSDKMYTRFWLSEYIPTLSSVLLSGIEIDLNNLERIFPEYNSFVVQENRSSGGFGTYILEKENFMQVIKCLHKDELYSISPYLKYSFSTNSQFVIFDDEILLLPASIQITCRNNNKLLYHGCDFISFRNIPNDKQELIKRYTLIIAEKLKNMGYRGIGGIDYLIEKENVYFLEINPRFQASSVVINKSLEEKKLPTIQELNKKAFSHEKLHGLKIENLLVNYSMFKILGSEQMSYIHFLYTCIIQDKNNVAQILEDGYVNGQKIDNYAHAYQVIYNTNISHINPDCQLNIHPNLLKTYSEIEIIGNPIKLKIALLNQGCQISSAAKSYLEKKGHIKKAVFNSIDFIIMDNLPINAPCNIKFSNYSPYIIEEINQKIYLTLYHHIISEINIELEDSLSTKTTVRGVKYSQLAYKSTDRLRLKHEKICYMKEQGGGCAFCNIPAKRKNFTFDDLSEVINSYLVEDTFRHILIGGASGNPDSEYKDIIKIAKYLKSKTQKHIYLMALPPKDYKVLDLFYEAGIDEIAFNIEIFSDTIAQKLMPIKGFITRHHYIDMLTYATTVWGTSGNVRTAFIAGLEPLESTLEGIRVVCQNGIQPMISVFRPLPATKLENYITLSNETLEQLYYNADSICEQFHQVLGPSCKWCRNNMLGL